MNKKPKQFFKINDKKIPSFKYELSVFNNKRLPVI